MFYSCRETPQFSEVWWILQMGDFGKDALKPTPTITWESWQKGEDNLRGSGGNAPTSHITWVLLRERRKASATHGRNDTEFAALPPAPLQRA